MGIQHVLKSVLEKFVEAGAAPRMKESLWQSYSIPGNKGLPRAATSLCSDGSAVENNKEKIYHI